MKPFVLFFIDSQHLCKEEKGGNGKRACRKVGGIVIGVRCKRSSVAVKIILPDLVVMPKIGWREKHGDKEQGKGEQDR